MNTYDRHDYNKRYKTKGINKGRQLIHHRRIKEKKQRK